VLAQAVSPPRSAPTKDVQSRRRDRPARLARLPKLGLQTPISVFVGAERVHVPRCVQLGTGIAMQIQ